jgi:hypothetical protein
LIILFGHLWEVELTYRIIFAFKFILRFHQPVLFPLFATCFINTGGKFAAGVIDTGGKLPPIYCRGTVLGWLFEHHIVSKKFNFIGHTLASF